VKSEVFGRHHNIVAMSLQSFECVVGFRWRQSIILRNWNSILIESIRTDVQCWEAPDPRTQRSSLHCQFIYNCFKCWICYLSPCNSCCFARSTLDCCRFLQNVAAWTVNKVSDVESLRHYAPESWGCLVNNILPQTLELLGFSTLSIVRNSKNQENNFSKTGFVFVLRWREGDTWLVTAVSSL
jgi:hypothetical protein